MRLITLTVERIAQTAESLRGQYPVTLRNMDGPIVTANDDGTTRKARKSQTATPADLPLTPNQADAYDAFVAALRAGDATVLVAVRKNGYITLPEGKRGRVARRGESLADILTAANTAAQAAKPPRKARKATAPAPDTTPDS